MAKEDKNRKVITVTVEGDDWIEALDKAFDKKVKDVTVAGFRKGKVPREVYEKKFGKESLFMDATDEVIQAAYINGIENEKIIPVAQPKIKIKSISEEKVEFEFSVVTKPELKIKKYKGLGVKKEVVKVTKEEIDHEIGHLLEKYAEVRTKEKGSIENGNIAIIDFEGFNAGVPFDGGKAENYELTIGSNTFIPGFEEQLVGMEVNTEKEIKVTFPEEYPQEDLKGKEVVFKVKLHEIKEKVQREFDKELFEDLAMDGIDSKEKLEAQIKENIQAKKETENENKYVDDILEAVSKNVEVDIPEEMVEEEVDRLLHRYEEQLKMQGISLDLYYQFAQTNEQELRNHLEKEAYSHVLYRLMLEEIAKLENIKITDKETEEEAQKLADKYKMEKEEFLKMFGGLDMIQYDLEMRKVVDLLQKENK